MVSKVLKFYDFMPSEIVGFFWLFLHRLATIIVYIGSSSGWRFSSWSQNYHLELAGEYGISIN